MFLGGLCLCLLGGRGFEWFEVTGGVCCFAAVARGIVVRAEGTTFLVLTAESAADELPGYWALTGKLARALSIAANRLVEGWSIPRSTTCRAGDAFLVNCIASTTCLSVIAICFKVRTVESSLATALTGAFDWRFDN